MGHSDLPIVSDELHVMPLVTLLDTVDAYSIAVCCVTGVTPVEIKFCLLTMMKHKTTAVIFESEDRNSLPVKIVHWVAGVT